MMDFHFIDSLPQEVFERLSEELGTWAVAVSLVGDPHTHEGAAMARLLEKIMLEMYLWGYDDGELSGRYRHPRWYLFNDSDDFDA